MLFNTWAHIRETHLLRIFVEELLETVLMEVQTKTSVKMNKLWFVCFFQVRYARFFFRKLEQHERKVEL